MSIVMSGRGELREVKTFFLSGKFNNEMRNFEDKGRNRVLSSMQLIPSALKMKLWATVRLLLPSLQNFYHFPFSHALHYVLL